MREKTEEGSSGCTQAFLIFALMDDCSTIFLWFLPLAFSPFTRVFYFPWLWTSSADKFVVLLFSLAVSLMGDGIPIQAIENARVNPLPTESDVFDFSYIPSLSFFVQPRMRVQKKSSIVLNMCFR